MPDPTAGPEDPSGSESGSLGGGSGELTQGGEGAGSAPTRLGEAIDSGVARTPGPATPTETGLPVAEGSSKRASPSKGSRPAATPPAAAGGLPRVFSHYVLLEEVGRGGIGVVYRALDPELDRWVAIKVLSAKSIGDEDMVRRFDEEARAVAALSHPGIVPLYEAGEFEGMRFLAMEFVEGKSLDRRVKEGPVPPAEALRIVREAAEAVHYAHSRGIIHRDIKPSNILVEGGGRVRLLDFGLAKRANVERHVTQTGEIVGTPAYMAPEQVTGEAEKTGPRTDVYGLGTVLYELVTGRPPFSGKAIEILFKVRDADPVPPRRHNRRVHRDIESICLKAMDKSPERRYASAEALAEDITRFLEGEPVVARGLTILTRVRRGLRRNRRLALAILVLSTAAAAAAGTFVLLPILAPPPAALEEAWEPLAIVPAPLSRRGEGWTVVAGNPEWIEGGVRLRHPRYAAIRLEDPLLKRGAAVEAVIEVPAGEGLGETGIALAAEGEGTPAERAGVRLSLGAHGNTRAVLQRGDGVAVAEAMGTRLESGRAHRVRLEHAEGRVRALVDGSPVLEWAEVFRWGEWVPGFRVELSVRGGGAVFRDLRIERRAGRLRFQLMDLGDRHALEGDWARARDVYGEVARQEADPSARDLATLKAILCRLPGHTGAWSGRLPLPVPPGAILSEARDELDRFLRERPRSTLAPLARLERARVLAWGGDEGAAEAALSESRSAARPGDGLDYDRKYFHAALGLSFLAAGRGEEALRQFDRAAEDLAGDPIQRQIQGKWAARSRLYLGDAAGAAEAFLRTAGDGTDRGESRRAIVEAADALLGAGKAADALALCERSLPDPAFAGDGLDTRLREIRIRSLLAVGRADEAAREAAAAAGPTGPDDRPSRGRFPFWLVLAEVEAGRGRTDEALRLLRAFELSSSTAAAPPRFGALEALAVRVRILGEAGRREAALDEAARLAKEVSRAQDAFRAPWGFKKAVPEALLAAAGIALDEGIRPEPLLDAAARRFAFLRDPWARACLGLAGEALSEGGPRGPAREWVQDLRPLLSGPGPFGAAMRRFEARFLVEEALERAADGTMTGAKDQLRRALRALGEAPGEGEGIQDAILRGDLRRLLGDFAKAGGAYAAPPAADAPPVSGAEARARLVLALRTGALDAEGLRAKWPATPALQNDLFFHLGEDALARAWALPAENPSRAPLLGEAKKRFEQCRAETPPDRPFEFPAPLAERRLRAIARIAGAQ